MYLEIVIYFYINSVGIISCICLLLLLLTAISQRDYKVYYVHLAQSKYQIMEEIAKFFKEKISGNFPVPNCK